MFDIIEEQNITDEIKNQLYNENKQQQSNNNLMIFIEKF